MFETKQQKVAPLSVFLTRLATSFMLGILIIAFAVTVGTLGYRFTEEMSWINAFANACMILSTMGPIIIPVTTAGKLFSAFYALFSGLLFVTMMGIIFAPVVHRFLHKFHAHHK